MMKRTIGKRAAERVLAPSLARATAVGAGVGAAGVGAAVVGAGVGNGQSTPWSLTPHDVDAPAAGIAPNELGTVVAVEQPPANQR